ncbi:MAG: hypothetical protein XD93_0362 [candidate division WS6 bacterium 34_10]|jgi:benzoyl-CoA reductase/2-hydroxyglutaryl-CoA dehydratase subunit BcrC/BadD/HgdB|uniref:Uncharacterized protein n=1 Tax=candidate division WS6 bacterium 34_10 TaxID=1641389 RepID=A0A101HIN4_9BACT|nr:MAG: hypothetical protein XD93_0362 [candidate division WS6 bacterium 34_10]
MSIPDKSLSKFKKIFEEMSGREWSDDGVRESAESLIRR